MNCLLCRIVISVFIHDSIQISRRGDAKAVLLNSIESFSKVRHWAQLRGKTASSPDFLFCEDKMTSNFEPTVMPGGESAGLFDSACNRLREITKARCVAVIVIDGESGSGYSVVGPLDAQVLLPDILQKLADTLRGQLSKNLQ